MVIQSNELKAKVLGTLKGKRNFLQPLFEVDTRHDENGLVEIMFITRCPQVIEMIHNIWLYAPFTFKLRKTILFIIRRIETRIAKLSLMIYKFRVATSMDLKCQFRQNIKSSVSMEVAMVKLDILLKLCHLKKNQLARILYRLEISRIPGWSMRRSSFVTVARSIDPCGDIIQNVTADDTTFGAGYLYKTETFIRFIWDLKQVFVDMNPIDFCVNLLEFSSDVTEAAIITHSYPDGDDYVIPYECFESHVNVDETLFEPSTVEKQETKQEKIKRKRGEMALVGMFLDMYKEIQRYWQ